MSHSNFTKHLTLSGKNRMEFSLIGGRIVIIKIYGNISVQFLETYIEERHNFLREMGLKALEFIELRDYSSISRITRKAVLQLKKEQYNNEKNSEFYPLAAFYINLPIGIRLIRSFQTQNSNLPYVAEVCHSQREALIRGINLLYERGFYSFAGKGRIKNREWFHDNPLYRESIQLLTNDLIYAESKGSLNSHGEPDRRKQWEGILQGNPNLKNGFSLILGLKEHDFEQEDIDNILSPYWLAILQENRCLRLLIITSQDTVAVAVNQTLTLNPLSFKIERRFEEALHQVLAKEEKRKERFKKEENRQSYSDDLEKLENYLLSLDIKKPIGNQLIPSETLTGQDPLRPIYQAVNLFYSQIQDEYNQVNSKWLELSKRHKETLLLQGVYEILYRDRKKNLTMEHCIEEIVEVFNEVMTHARASVFLPENNSFHCVHSSSKDRPSLKGTIFPPSISSFINEKPLREIHFRDLSHRMSRKEKLSQGPFLQSFLKSQNISMILFRPMLDEENPTLFLVIDFTDDTSPEADYITHLLNQVIYLLKSHFGNTQVPLPPPINRDEALSEYDNDKDFFTQVLGSFITSLKDQLNLMKKAAQEKEHVQLRREAHKIKGGAANLFAKDLQKAAFDLEENASREKDQNYPRNLESLKEEVKRLEEWFQRDWL